LVLEKVKEYNYPVCFDFPVGHVKENYALKCGIMHELRVGMEEVVLVES
jgi:muramoyltetrapeptide carboxypeptidase